MDRLFERGITVRNQTVLQRGVNDDVATMRLLVKRLSYVNVHPYYVYMHDLVKGVEDLRTTLSTGLDDREGDPRRDRRLQHAAGRRRRARRRRQARRALVRALRPRNRNLGLHQPQRSPGRLLLLLRSDRSAAAGGAGALGRSGAAPADDRRGARGGDRVAATLRGQANMSGGCTECKNKGGCDHRKGAMMAAVDEALARLYPAQRWAERDEQAAFRGGVPRADGIRLAELLAARLKAMALFRPGADDEYCDYVYVLCFGRTPSILEIREGLVADDDADRRRRGAALPARGAVGAGALRRRAAGRDAHEPRRRRARDHGGAARRRLRPDPAAPVPVAGRGAGRDGDPARRLRRDRRAARGLRSRRLRRPLRGRPLRRELPVLSPAVQRRGHDARAATSQRTC